MTISALGTALLLFSGAVTLAAPGTPATQWQPVGWGGGGWYWACAFHPTRDGVIYLGGDVAGVYKSEDHGRHWRMINRGLIDYGVYSLAVDPRHPDTVYAGTLGGICRSTDAGEHWVYLEATAKDQLDIAVARNQNKVHKAGTIPGLAAGSVRALAVGPSGTLFAATPKGKIFRSDDAGTTWRQLYQLPEREGFSYITVAPGDANFVLAAGTAGVFLSRDAGQTWTKSGTSRAAVAVAVAPHDPNLLYAALGREGVVRSTDRGKRWTPVDIGLQKKAGAGEILIDAVDSRVVFCIASDGWNGYLHKSADGGQTWTNTRLLRRDLRIDPTVPDDYAWLKGPVPMSTLENIAANPQHPEELFIAGNERPCWSGDAGATWEERDAGADITCTTDIRFSGRKTYVTAMDEGLLASDDQGATWRQLAPRKFDPQFSGHEWRVLVLPQGGREKIVSTLSPWAAQLPNRVLLSADGGQTFWGCRDGLPDYRPAVNTVWGQSYPRGLAADPGNPDVLYLGMDGDPGSAPGKTGGGIFKSADGGHTWQQLPNQPGSRKMFYGLAVDPSQPRRIFWGACGRGGGLYRSDDAGQSWQHVFQNETWICNVLVTADGSVYCPGANLWRSTDHGVTWKKLTAFRGSMAIVGLEVDPHDPKRIWLSRVTWQTKAVGGVYESRDGGVHWDEITGDLGYVKPLVLRYNPETRELWAGGVGLFKTKR